MEIDKDEIRCIYDILFPRSPVVFRRIISLISPAVREREVTCLMFLLLQMRKLRNDRAKWMAKNIVKWVTRQGKRNWVLEIVIISRAEEYPSIISNKIKPSCWFLRMYLNQSREHVGLQIRTTDVLLQVLGMMLADALLGFFSFWPPQLYVTSHTWSISWHLVIGYRFPSLTSGFYYSFLSSLIRQVKPHTYFLSKVSLCKSWLNSCHFPLNEKKSKVV